MKTKTFVITSICSIFLGTSTGFAATDHSNIEKQEKPSYSSWKNWNSTFTPVSSVLHPSSPKAAGMLEAPLNQIDQIMSDAIAAKVMPGAVAFVARGGKIVKQTAYGYSAEYVDSNFTKMDNPIPATVDTIYDLASISKLFTTTAAMILFDQGKFQLDDPVAKYIPEFAQNGKESVTIKQLLTHTSGFEPDIPFYQMSGTREEKLQQLYKHGLQSAPGTTYVYSDLNMITLGALVERLSGEREDVFVKEHITDPLGMKDTMYNPPASLKERIAATEEEPWVNRGLVWGSVHDENAWALDGVAGHAGVFSTAKDLATLAHIYINDGKYDGKQILKPETVKLMLQNYNTRFPGDDHALGWELGQGWYMDALSDGNTFGHTGYTGTSIVVNPNNKTVAILLTNRVHPTRNTVSTNQTRRLFVRQVADSIPVDIPGKQAAWFAGYGDKLNKVMEANLNLTEDAKLTFSTWYKIENGWDFGNVEVQIGDTWKKLEQFTGNSSAWENQEAVIPKEASKLRFVYKTDSSTNGRGWYILNPKVEGQALNFTTNDWQLRDY
jgi:CubicO group peptidase (beta-lactamase class C family)